MDRCKSGWNDRSLKGIEVFRSTLCLTFMMSKKVGIFSNWVFFIQNLYCALGRMTVSLQSSLSPIPDALDTHENPVKTVFFFSQNNPATHYFFCTCLTIVTVRHPQCRSTWCSFKCSKRTYSNVFILVDVILTRGAQPAWRASSQRMAQRHQRSPFFKPLNPYSGLGVTRSFPLLLENLRNWSSTIVQTVWVPTSPAPVLQHPSRKNPVTGSVPQTSKFVPRTFFWVSGISAPTNLFYHLSKHILLRLKGVFYIYLKQPTDLID